ncbi:MAG TPA: DEAD/DEAH box helicase family protein [Flavobacteriales bacterium]|nr:DEAD/DEAH box helicase family protein [Flavobacteriales bacterium]
MELSPFDILHPDQRWRPSPEQQAGKNYDELIPPLVDKVRREVAKWRDAGYPRCSDTSRSLLNFWFGVEHAANDGFRFYFSQREAIESIIWLHEVAQARDKFGLMRYDSSGRVSTGMFDETWTRYVVKMATGSGKTKVLGLALVWSYFHKLYEADSPLSRNFLIIAPNIIVLNRLLKDFGGLAMFREEPFLPENGWGDRNWQVDFRPQLHIQDEVGTLSPDGNIFLTNIHRVFFNEEPEQTVEELFLGKKPKADADTNRGLDLGKLLRSDKLTDLVVMNDEAHHIHDKGLAWFQAIQDIHSKLMLRTERGLSIQVDFSATPKHNNGSIFVQTICDYPLVEAITHNVVKTPVLPDRASREKLQELDSTDLVEQFRDHIHLGYQEWEKQYNEIGQHRTPILFYMTMNTEEADQLSAYLQESYPLLQGRVLVIHTKNNGELKGEGTKTKKDKDELERLRKAADSIDDARSPYLCVVSVLVLREGWDVRNVSTIVGLRPYKATSNILPEQTLGRGLRKMFTLEAKEQLVVVGTRNFLDFVESLKTEGVTFEYKPMGGGGPGKSPLIVEVETGATDRDIKTLDIPLPILTPKFYRDYEVLGKLGSDMLFPGKVDPKKYTLDEIREIDFEDLHGRHSHTTELKGVVPDHRNVLGALAQQVLKNSKLFQGFDALYPLVRDYATDKLFTKVFDAEDPQFVCNLTRPEAKRVLYDTFKQAIDSLTVKEAAAVRFSGYRSLLDTPVHIASEQPALRSAKTVFNRVLGQNDFERGFAGFLNKAPDVTAFARNTQAVKFFMEYQKGNGNISSFNPDFLARTGETDVWIIETKGREDEDDKRKIMRLRQWCIDVNAVQDRFTYHPLYVKEETWDAHYNALRTFADLAELCHADTQATEV